jgi:Uma2 family endonuclease
MSVIVNPVVTVPGFERLGVAGPVITLAEFLAWEREQPERFEFDGRQPIPMTGGSLAHARMIRKIMEALACRLPAGYEWLPGDLKVISSSRVRYPDVLVINQEVSPNADDVLPVAVFEVLSPSTALTDLRVKPADYAAVETIQV